MIFNLNDIRHFLLEKNYPWDMQVVDNETGEKRLATMEDFNYSRTHTLTKLVFNYRFGEITKDMHITDFKFLTYDEESNIMGSGSNITLDEVFSKDWINFLLFKHKKEYDTQTKRLSNTNTRIHQCVAILCDIAQSADW